MLFEYKRRLGARSPVTDAATFRVDAVSRMSGQEPRPIDVSHLIDPSYDYHSTRELRWHLAERFGVTPASVAIHETA